METDFELATCIFWMVDLNTSYKWQMGNGIFAFDLFSLSSAACSLIGALLTALPSLFTFTQQVNAPEQPGIPVHFFFLKSCHIYGIVLIRRWT